MSKALRIAVGSDHGGFELKTHIVSHLTALGHSVEDCGTHSKDAVDYPRFAAAVVGAWPPAPAISASSWTAPASAPR